MVAFVRLPAVDPGPTTYVCIAGQALARTSSCHRASARTSCKCCSVPRWAGTASARWHQKPEQLGQVSVACLRRAAAPSEWPGCTSARGWAWPRRVTGESMVVWSVSWEPCPRGRPSRRAARGSGSDAAQAGNGTVVRSCIFPGEWGWQGAEDILGTACCAV